MSEFNDIPPGWENPDWTNEVHCWRNYVGEEIRNIWVTFSLHQRRELARSYDEIAARADWE